MSKKIIRLTESELMNLIKRVLNENTMETLSPPVQIKINDEYHGNTPLLWDLTEIYRGPSYCEFRGKPRGVSANWKPEQNYGDGFIYKCNEKTFTSNTSGDARAISDEASKRVRESCGCDQYVKKNNTFGSNAV
jgi:hypothetical protein